MSLVEQFVDAVCRALGGQRPFADRVAMLREFRDRGLAAKEAEQALQAMRAGTDEETEAQILDLLDIATGWCGPGIRVWPIVNASPLDKLTDAIRESVGTLAQTSLAGYALMTDDELGSVFGMAITDAEIAESSDGDILFTPNDWPHEFHGDLFNAISRSLFATEHASDRDFRDHVRVSFETLVEALARLRLDGFFASSVFLSAGSTDPSQHLEALESASIRRLNDRSLVEAHERFMARWAHQRRDEMDEAARLQTLRAAIVRLHDSRESLQDPLGAIEELYAEHDYPREIRHLVSYEPGERELRAGETPVQGLYRSLDEYVQMIFFSREIGRLLDRRAPSSELVSTLRDCRAKGLLAKLAAEELERLRAGAVEDAIEIKLLELIALL